MPETPDWTVVLSGPLAQRPALLSTLERAGMIAERSLGQRGDAYGLPDEDSTVGWVAVRHSDVDAVAEAGRRSSFALRLHWPTPGCRACAGTGQVSIGDAGLGACLHCEGGGRTNKPLPTPEEQTAALINALADRIAVLEGRA